MKLHAIALYLPQKRHPCFKRRPEVEFSNLVMEKNKHWTIFVKWPRGLHEKSLYRTSSGHWRSLSLLSRWSWTKKYHGISGRRCYYCNHRLGTRSLSSTESGSLPKLSFLQLIGWNALPTNRIYGVNSWGKRSRWRVLSLRIIGSPGWRVKRKLVKVGAHRGLAFFFFWFGRKRPDWCSFYVDWQERKKLKLLSSIFILASWPSLPPCFSICVWYST